MNLRQNNLHNMQTSDVTFMPEQMFVIIQKVDKNGQIVMVCFIFLPINIIISHNFKYKRRLCECVLDNS